MTKVVFLLSVFLITNILADTKCLRYGVIPYVNISEIESYYQDWKKYLEKKIHRCIKINYENSYGEIINKFSKNELDFAFVGPFSYVLTKKVAEVEPIVTGVTKDGFATYKSLFVVTPEVAQTLNISTPLKGALGMSILKSKLEQHKQKWILAFTDESSTSGYAVPNYYMKKANIKIEDYFKQITFVGTHDAAELVVANNIIPMAATAEMFYYQLIEDKKISTKTNIIIWESDDIPKSPIIVQKSLSQELKNSLQDALISMPKNFVPRLGKTIMYKKTNSTNYAIIEDIYKYIE